MKRIEEVYREMLFQCMERKNKTMTQSYLAHTLKMSLSVVNLALSPLKQMNAVEIRRRSFNIIDPKKLLYYWASVRKLQKDIIYQTRVDKNVGTIESEMPADIIYAAYSAYKFRFKDIPADYSEVYVYSNGIKEIEKRFPKNNKTPNLFVLKKDRNMKNITLALIFVDLWNLREWYTKDFLKAMEDKLNGILE